MNKIVICCLLSNLFALTSYAQNLNFSFGVESNLLFFRQNGPTIEVPFSNPHNPSLGIGVNGSLAYKLNKTYSLRFSPLIGFYRSNSNVTSDFQMNIFGFNIGPEFQYKNFVLHFGYEYNRLNDFLGKFNGKITNYTNSRVTYKRNLSALRLESGYYLSRNFKGYCGVSYFFTDFHRHGALDYNGNLVGPVELTPLVIFIGVDYKIDFSKLNKSKK